MGIPYETRPIIAPVTGGQPNCVEIDFPSRSILNKLAIVQVDGLTPVNLTVALYSNKSACQGKDESTSDSAGEVDLPPDLYRVTPDLTSSSAGKLFYFSETQTGGHGFVFFNQDPPSNQPLALPGQVGGIRKIYLMLTPAGSAHNKFAIILGGEVYL